MTGVLYYVLPDKFVPHYLGKIITQSFWGCSNHFSQRHGCKEKFKTRKFKISQHIEVTEHVRIKSKEEVQQFT